MRLQAERRSAQPPSASQPLGKRSQSAAVLCAAVAAAVLAGCGGGSGAGGAPPRFPTPSPTPVTGNFTRISSDPFSNASSQHATEVEPDVVAQGQTVVSTFQAGRFFVAGASGIGFSTSRDGGRTWQAGILPGITRVQQVGNAYDTASDPTVAYDAAHGDWLIASLPVLLNGAPLPVALVSRSKDGIAWGLPVAVAPRQRPADKNWIACDDTPTSPFYGHCYIEWDDPFAQGLVKMSTSTDGGITWSAPLATANGATGIGGHPVVQPNGTVVVPLDDFNQENILAFVSTDGGASWSVAVNVSNVSDHEVAAGMRTSPLPTAAVDASGVVYVVWQDCRFRVGCASNDLVLSTSLDGVHWGTVMRIPIDARSSTVDHFIPGLSAAPGSGGTSARLALAYYFFPLANCSLASCQLDVGFVGSRDGGRSWSAPEFPAGPMALATLPATRDGLMVGDYIATAFSNGTPLATFAVAEPLQGGGVFNEAMYVPKRAPQLLDRGAFHRAGLDRPIPGVVSDHAPRPPRPRREQ
jgi:hypothetical protein